MNNTNINSNNNQQQVNESNDDAFTAGEIKGLICGIFGTVLLAVCVFRLAILAGL